MIAQIAIAASQQAAADQSSASLDAIHSQPRKPHRDGTTAPESNRFAPQPSHSSSMSIASA
jgi:hypothetical protein